jgi:hypothetical protein
MNYKATYDRIKVLTSKTQRGFAFEKLINKIFDEREVLINNSYKTVDLGQQIDGAIEIKGRVFLLEAKWEKKETLAASKLYSFLGKINSKLEGTIGIFISHDKLSDNFVNAIRDGLRQNCILIHGKENIIDIVEGKLKLDEFVWYCYRDACTKNKSEFSTSDYLSLPPSVSKSTSASLTSPSIQNNWDNIYTELTNGSNLNNFVNTLSINYIVGNDFPDKVVNLLPTLSYNSVENEKLKELIDKICELELEGFEKSLKIKLSGNYYSKYANPFIISILPKAIYATDKECELIIENVTKGFNGDWEIENEASRILELIFKNFNDINLILVAKKFLDIYLDTSRQDRFEQKQFATKVITKVKQKHADLFDLFRDEIFQNIKSLKNIQMIWIVNEYETIETVREGVIQRIILKYNKFIEKDQREAVKTQIEEYYDTL